MGGSSRRIEATASGFLNETAGRTDTEGVIDWLRMLRADRRLTGWPLVLDRGAESASSALPAFLCRPDGAPVYFGFPVDEQIAVDGFRLGEITPLGTEGCEGGDAFIVAPDGGRAGLVWEVAPDDLYVEEVIPPADHRWGVWGVGMPAPIDSQEAVRDALAYLIPRLRPHREAWQRRVRLP